MAKPLQRLDSQMEGSEGTRKLRERAEKGSALSGVEGTQAHRGGFLWGALQEQQVYSG